jgi:hypothetical protein
MEHAPSPARLTIVRGRFLSILMIGVAAIRVRLERIDG